MILLGLLARSIVFPGAAEAITPAGTRIPCISSVTCLMNGIRFSFLSNTVDLTVSQLNALDFDAPKTGEARPGKSVSFAHTVANRGNVTDTFTLDATTSAAATVELLAGDGATPLTDSNGDGKPDTPPLLSGAEFAMVIKVTVPQDARAGNVAVTIKATSTGDPSATAAVQDTVTVINPQFRLSESVSPAGQVTPGGELTYKIAIGTDQTVTNVTITDTLDPNLTYIDQSATLPAGIDGARSSYGSGAALPLGIGGAKSSKDGVSDAVTWSFPSVPGSFSGSVSLRARVNPATPSDTVISNVITIVSDQSKETQYSNRINVAVVEQPLRVTMTAGKTEAEAGELVPYTVTVENVSKTMTASQVDVVATLPKGFRYAKGSASLDGAPLPDASNAALWHLGVLEPGKKRSLDYRTIVSIDAPVGQSVNSVMATGTSPAGYALASPVATARVKILEGVLNGKTIILGRVFVDLNRDRMPDENEPGVPGVRLYLENGYFAVTDREGKFSIVGVETGEHVLKLDRSTLPPTFDPEALDSSFAGDGGSRFITLPFGGTARGDFGVSETETKAILVPKQEKPPPPEERELTFGTETTAGPPSLEEQIAAMPESPEILEPAKGTILRKPWTDIVIRVPDGADYTLRVNEEPLLSRQIGKRIVEKRRKLRINHYVGVRLQPGPNRIELEVVGADGRSQLQRVEVVAPGDAAKVRVSPEKGNIPADGKTVVPFTVTFLDQWDHELATDIIFTVASEKGEILEKDIDPATPGHQLKAAGGKGSFHLRSTAKTGADRVGIVAGSNLEGSADLFFTPHLRKWLVTGLGSVTLGSNSTSGKTEKITEDELKDGFHGEGRVAFFAKGAFLDQYLITAAFDSDKAKRKELFQRIPPDRYYPIYGDESVQGYEAESQRKYYLKVEKDRSSLLIGDFNTNLSSTEFTRYERSFNGGKADIDTTNFTLRAFGTSTDHSANKDEFPGNGTSGYYFLRKRDIIENTDKIRIEIRDRYHSERIISATEKVPYLDYSLDYRTGAILFREPVPSYDANLNPVYIVALYESEDSRDDNFIYGGRGAIRSEQGSQLGVTAVVEENGDSTNSLYGVDGVVKIGEKTAVVMEAAASDTVAKGDGTAVKTEFRTQVEKAVVDGYYRRVSKDFLNPSMSGSEIGTEKYGAKVSYQLLEKTKLLADGFVQSDLINHTELTNTTLGVSQQISRFSLDSGYRYIRGREDDPSSGTTITSQMVYAGAGGKLTERLEASLLQEQAFSSETVKDYPSRTLAKLNYKLNEATSAFVTEEFRESGASRGNNTLMGISSKLFENVIVTTSYTETTGTDRGSQLGTEVSSKWNPAKAVTLTTKTGYQIQNTMTGDRGQALLGVDTSWEALPGLRLGAKAERVQLVTGSNDPAGINTALALSAGYLGNENLKTTVRYEFRNSPGETAHLSSLGAAYKLSGSFSLLGKATFWLSSKVAGDDTLFDGQVGGAYRPMGRNSLYLLGVLRFKDDSKGSTPSGEEVRSLITSVEFSDRLRQNLTLHGKYAAKYSWDTLFGRQLQAYSDMMLAGATYDVTERWDVDLSAKVMNQYDSGVRSTGLIPQIGYRVHKNARVAVGYNFLRVDDRDLSGESYSSNGPFIQLKFKFDEISIEDLYTGVTGKRQVATAAPPPAAKPVTAPGTAPLAAPVAAPPPPAPALPMAVVSMALSEEPVEIVGSVEALKVLVNDKEVSLERADVRMAGGAADDVVERRGGESEKPVEFEVEASSPEEVLSWRVAITNLEGETVHVLRGTEAPDVPLLWDLRTDSKEPLKSGEIYLYRAEVKYADGSTVTGPFRLFGVNRPILDQHREPPFVKVAGSAVAVDEVGRFSRTLPQKSEQVEVEMMNAEGRSIRKICVIPKVTLEPQGGVDRVPYPKDQEDARRPLNLSYTVHGKVSPGDAMALNGRKVPVAEDGSFSMMLQLSEQEGGYWIEVRNAQGYCRHFRLKISATREKHQPETPVSHEKAQKTQK